MPPQADSNEIGFFDTINDLDNKTLTKNEGKQKMSENKSHCIL